MAAAVLGAVAQSQWRWFNYRLEGRSKAVFSVFRDSRSRMWIGGSMGVCLFDGFEGYPCSFGDDRFQAQVYDMAEHEGVIYLGTNNGLFLMNPSELSVDALEVATPLEIRSLCKDGDTLWIGSLNGLFRYSLGDGTISGPEGELSHQAVYCLMLSAGGTLYAGTYDGLCRREGDTFRRIRLETGRLPGGNEFVNSLSHGPDGAIYIGLEGALLQYNPASGTCTRIHACDGNSVKSLALLDGNIAAGTDNGLYIVAPDGRATVLKHNAREDFSLMSNVVWTLYASNGHTLWAGTETGLSIADPDSPVQVFPLADLTGDSGGQQVYRILRDSHDILWLGGSNGLIAVDGGRTTWYLPGSSEYPLSHNRVRDITETSDGNLWVATDGGLNLLDRSTGRFVNHRIADPDHNVNANWTYGIVEDPSDSTIWAAGYLGGVFVEKTSRFRNEGTMHRPDTVYTAADGLPNDLIGQMVIDGDGNKWVLHYRDRSLSRIDGRSGELTRVSFGDVIGADPSVLCTGADGSVWCGVYGGVVRIYPDGRIDPRVVSLPFADDSNITALCDVAGTLWVSTEKAVYTVDPATMNALVLPLPALEYSCIYSDKVMGKVILGSVDEIVIVDPQRLRRADASLRAEVFRILEGGRMLVSYVSDSVRTVELPNVNRDIEVDLGVRDFEPGAYYRFCYRLDDEPWRLLEENRNSISFTSLPSGRHTLRISVAGVPESARSIVFDVARPWYAGGVAITFYILAFGTVIALSVHAARRRQRRKIEEMERRSVLASVDRRLTFLSNISHELKTPLSMIIGPLSRARGEEARDKVRGDIDTAYRNAVKLNTLVHQTIEINRLDDDSDTMLIYSRIDAVEFCRDMVEAYRASHPDRHFLFSADCSRLDVRVDVVKLESLLSNLFSNAVKYSPEGSTVACSVRAEGENFEISVADDGVGIPESEQSLIFQRLYRSPRTSASVDGTGIGLYLVRRYAQLLGGDITLESTPGEGSAFCLRLPVDGGDDSGEERLPASTSDGSDKRPRVLIVDDNRSIAGFVASVLSDDFNCATASNGRSGLTVAATFKPDIVIADEMMPVMTGLEMSRRLKANPATAVVPILLLTAKDTPETHGESLESGVDAFMAKPFEARALLTKVKRLVEASEEMRKRLRLEALTQASAPETPAESVDEKRLSAVTSLIENNISNPDLNVAFVCDKTGMTSKTLYRLVKKLTGVSPLDYIRQTRLRQAAMLLEQGKFSVSEVMYMVGFNSSGYFSKCFSQQFGCTPGAYADGARGRSAKALPDSSAKD